MGIRIFLNYRREDAEFAAGRLYDRLAQWFGPASVFMDVDDIDYGTDFAERIDKAMSTADVLIVLIGPRWAGPEDARRIEQPNDFVRLEIESALERNMLVIPVLIGGVSVPSEDELPPSLAPLSRRHGLKLEHATFDADVEDLIRSIRRTLGPRAAPSLGSPAVVAGVWVSWPSLPWLSCSRPSPCCSHR
ncbi:MAG: toll/interleukin-1 receptor domain-containing protein [Myxococcota bacterium]